MNDAKLRIEQLDDVHAINVVRNLTSAIYTRIGEPAFGTMLDALEQATGVEKSPPASREALSQQVFRTAEAGQLARAVLAAWAQHPASQPAVEAAIDKFRPTKQDLGVLSVPVALGLTYALIALDLDLDLKFVKIRKAGLTGEQQADIVKKTVEPILKAIRGE